MLKISGGVYLNKEEQQELLDRARRTETRLIRLLELSGSDAFGTCPDNKKNEPLLKAYLTDALSIVIRESTKNGGQYCWALSTAKLFGLDLKKGEAE